MRVISPSVTPTIAGWVRDREVDWLPKTFAPGDLSGAHLVIAATSAPGVMISEHLPKVAQQFKHLSVIRSLDSKEGNHDRGTYMMHTGYAPKHDGDPDLWRVGA